MAKKLMKQAKKTGVSILAIPAKVGQCRPCPHLAALEAGHARRPLQPGVPLLARLAHGPPRPRHPVPARARVTLLALAALLARAARLALLSRPTCYDMFK